MQEKVKLLMSHTSPFVKLDESFDRKNNTYCPTSDRRECRSGARKENDNLRSQRDIITLCSRQ
jgi:hypothetical protein